MYSYHLASNEPPRSLPSPKTRAQLIYLMLSSAALTSASPSSLEDQAPLRHCQNRRNHRCPSQSHTGLGLGHRSSQLVDRACEAYAHLLSGRWK
ncbi:hypothetical protein CC86DRAFT_196374 [Ophiobolus disseminans]|uniref:Uncharacterized protein n=1 Tax=Ophiobolus disseminans TaxID=1469910 RepID=A0A6A7A7K3_9PLEO|nr:hypothetical protein CC86DRAFT_196374 [Ophiobolus disseminans]